MPSKAPQLAPFDHDGNLLDYTLQAMGIDREYREGSGNSAREDWQPRVTGVYWKPREQFSETMTVFDMSRGRSSVTLSWRTQDGRIFPMFISDFMELLLRGDLGAGVPGLTLSGTWLVRKSGSNYGVKLVEKDA